MSICQSSSIDAHASPKSQRDSIIDYISPQIKVTPSKFALVFGSRHAQSPLSSAASKLFQDGMFEYLIISGGRTQNIDVPEAYEIFVQLKSCGIPSSRMILEERAMNTSENVAYSRALVPSNTDSILLIGKIYAKRRYAMTVKSHWPEIRSASIFDVNYFSVPRKLWWQDRTLRRRIFCEARKIPHYIKQKYIKEVTITNEAIDLRPE